MRILLKIASEMENTGKIVCGALDDLTQSSVFVFNVLRSNGGSEEIIYSIMRLLALPVFTASNLNFKDIRWDLLKDIKEKNFDLKQR